MSKEIFLYSEDKKYKCAFELSDTLDKNQIPDHSVMILFEEREDGNYVIAEARDKILVTEKDTLIASLELEKSDLVREKADLEAKLAKSEKINEYFRDRLEKADKEIKEMYKKYNELVKDYNNLKQQLAEKEEYIEMLLEEKGVYIDLVSGYSKKCKDYEQQLAEKEKEIESLKLCKCASCKNEYDFMLEGMVADLEKELDKCNQDKTTFAIEKLEQVKEFCENWKQTSDYCEYVITQETTGIRCVPTLNDFIDQLISEIKGENDG